ncbi:MAG: M48 family metallopeptidase [Planctomycetota bacterium]
MSTWPLMLIGMVLVAGVVGEQRGASGAWLPGWGLLLVVLSSKAAIAIAAGWVGWRAGRAKTPGAVDRGELWLRRLQGLLLLSLGVDLSLGWLSWLRAMTGDAVLLDEGLAVLPTLAGWWVVAMAGWPIERRVRVARLMRELDAGLSPSLIETSGSGGAWVWAAERARHELAAVLVGVLAIVGWAETVDRVDWPPAGWLGGWAREAAVMAGAFGLAVALPLLVRWTWRVRVLDAGPLHDELTGTLRAGGVRAPTLLLWRAPGRAANAAVVGLVRGLRYVLVSEALVEGMNSAERRAVVAHEAGHVRHGHMALLGVASIGLLLCGYAAGEAFGATADAARVGWWAAGMALAAWVVGFGWVSRRIERQADADAARVLHREGEGADASIDAVRSALLRVAELNGVSARRWTWRHGSITQRRDALDRLHGVSLDRLPIDRTVRGIWLASLAMLIAGIAWWVWGAA